MCFKSRKGPALIVSGLSVFVVIFGLLLLVMAIIFQSSNSVLTADMGDLTEFISRFRVGVFIVVLLFAIVALAVGGAGVCCQCKPCRKSPCAFAACYGISIGLVWIVFIIVGSIVTGVSNVGPKQIKSICDGESAKGFAEEYIDYVYEIDG